MSHGTRMSESCHRCDTRRNQGLLYCCPPATFWMSPGVSTVWCGMLQWVVMWCSVLQCVAVCCSVLQCVAVCAWEWFGAYCDATCSGKCVYWGVLQCVAVCDSVAVSSEFLAFFRVVFTKTSFAVYGSVVQCNTDCCNVSQFVAVCCSMLHYVVE